MSLSKCVHCGADSDPAATGGYCVNCGKQQADASNPVESAAPAAATDEARKAAAQALFGVAGLYLFFGVAGLLLFAWLQPAPGNGAEISQAFRILNVLVVPVFGGLGLWARSKPLAAAVAGLVLYAGLTAMQLVAGQARGMGIAIMFMILGVLGWAVIVNAKARRSAS